MFYYTTHQGQGEHPIRVVPVNGCLICSKVIAALPPKLDNLLVSIYWNVAREKFPMLKFHKELESYSTVIFYLVVPLSKSHI